MDLLVSHVVVGVVFAMSGLSIGWWLHRHWPNEQLLHDDTDTQLVRELMASLHRLSVRMAEDVGEHNTRVSEVDKELAAQPKHSASVISTLVNRLMKANEKVQAKLAHAESKLDELTHEMEFHATEARTDVLTGLPNRRAFQEVAAESLTEFRETNRAFAMVIVDVDRFKRVNDMFGHALGDEVLRGIGATLAANAGKHDIVSRYGGEEFAILMPNMSLEDARRNTEALREAVEDAKHRLGDELLGVTISAGIARILPSEDMASLIQRTDEAMYAAKHAGRNCVFWHDGTQTRSARSTQDKAPSASVTPAPPMTATAASTPETTVHPTVSRAAAPPVSVAPDVDLLEPQSIDLDLLNNLNNKTMFCQDVYRRVAEFNHGGPTFSTILLNVDNHSQLAREHGTIVAELSLGVVTQAIRESVRSLDLVARYDDTTFALILPGAMLRNAVCIGERLRKEVRRTGIMVDGEPIQFTISLGIVEVADGDVMATHVERACAQLRQASRSGGDRTGFAAVATS